jgi:spore maturation protein SpmB
MMDGGKKGVEMGLAIIPGVLIICSIVLMFTNGRPVCQYKYASILQINAAGESTQTPLIEIPDKGNYILWLQPDTVSAYWTKNSPVEEDPTYSFVNGRIFAENERLHVKMPTTGFDGDNSSYRIVLYKADETTKIEIPLTKNKRDDYVYDGTVPLEPYRGNAGEGIGVLPWLANLLSFILTPLFGFSTPEAVAVPVTALGSAGAALGLIPGFIKDGLVNINDLAVFTAVCMCWSGYLSTHVSMMEVLGCREHTGKALISHTIGGLFAGVAAHWLFVLFSLL